MKRTVLAAMLLPFLTAAVALADPPQDNDHHHDQRQERRHEEKHGRRMEHARAHVYFDSGRYVRPHGYYAHRWRRGERLPLAFRGGAYVIANPAVYRLRPPPRGYYWVRVDNNAVLAAVATGVVVDVSLNLFR